MRRVIAIAVCFALVLAYGVLRRGVLPDGGLVSGLLAAAFIAVGYLVYREIMSTGVDKKDLTSEDTSRR